MEIRMWDGHPTCDKISDEQSALLRESLAELVFLLFRQVGLNDLELLAFDCFNNLVKHTPLVNRNKAEVPLFLR